MSDKPDKSIVGRCMAVNDDGTVSVAMFDQGAGGAVVVMSYKDSPSRVANLEDELRAVRRALSKAQEKADYFERKLYEYSSRARPSDQMDALMYAYGGDQRGGKSAALAMAAEETRSAAYERYARAIERYTAPVTTLPIYAAEPAETDRQLLDRVMVMLSTPAPVKQGEVVTVSAKPKPTPGRFNNLDLEDGDE